MSFRFRDSVRKRLSGIMRKSPSRPSSTADPQGSTRGSSTSLFEGPLSLNDATRQTWTLPTINLSVHSDAPRICHKVKIIGKDGSVVFNGDESATTIQNLLNMFLGMNACFPEDPLRTKDEDIITAFNLHVSKEDGDIGEQVHNFLQSKVINESCLMMSMLKFITLDVASTAIYRLRDTLFEKYPYRGVNGSWGIQYIMSGDSILIIHSKKEQSVSEEEGCKFNFSWKCNFIWQVNSDRLQVSIIVTGLDFDDEMKFRNRKEIRDLLDSFVDQTNAYRLIWDRPIKRQPIHKDLVRLCSRLKIVHEKEGILHQPDENDETPTYQLVYTILELIAQYAKEPEILKYIKQHYYEFVRTEGDLSEQLLKFFLSRDDTGKSVFEKTNCSRILNCVNQELLFPAVMTLRANIYEHFPFKDVKGGWNVIIYFGADTMSVSHVKKEQSHDQSEGYFEFEWILKCIMSYNDAELFQPTMKITNYDWNIRTSAEIRKKVLDGLMPLIEKNVMYERILLKPMQKMSLHSDLVRFLRKDAFTIYYGDKEIFSYSAALGEDQQVETILNIFCDYLKDSHSKTIIQEHFHNYIKGGAGFSEQLKNFFSQGELFNDTLTLVTFLKLISSDMYFASYLNLRNTFFSSFPFRDVKGTGRLKVRFSTPEEISSGLPQYVVAHCKKEQSGNNTPTQYFEFEWELKLTVLDLEKKSLMANLAIIGFEFNDHTSHDFMQDILAAWNPFLPESLKRIVRLREKKGSEPKKRLSVIHSVDFDEKDRK